MCDGAAHPPVGRRAVLAALTTLASSGLALPAAPRARAATRRPVNPWTPGVRFYRGDHHVHSHYSDDGMNPVARLAAQARAHGLDWMVVTDHGGVAHAKLDLVRVAQEIVTARTTHPGLLVYQGLEWNVPGAEHATVFVPPGGAAADVLRTFETSYDGAVLATSPAAGGLGTLPGTTAAAGEPYAVAGLKYLGRQVSTGRVPVALVLANHPARRGLDSPHELRAWRDAAPGVAVGMEGAPGHQAQGLPTELGGLGGHRGGYDAGPAGDSFAGYPSSGPRDHYRTYGGFDPFTALVGGVWDALLAEGRPWWVTAASDSHQVHRDPYAPGGGDFTATGTVGPPVASLPEAAADFWPGAYSSTLVGAPRCGYVDVMRGLQSGQAVAVHGRLVDGLDVRVRPLTGGDARGVTLGGRTVVRRGGTVELTVRVILPAGPHGGGVVPRLRTLDVIAGPVTGPTAARDTATAPRTTVVRRFEVAATARGSVTFTHRFTKVAAPFYVRLRGSDGNRLDAAGNPLADASGAEDPWSDLWFYANPVFVDLM